MIPGTVITLSGKKFLLPPMNLETMEVHQEFLGRAMRREMDENRMIADMVELGVIVHETLKQNYPDLELAEVKRGLTMAGLQGMTETLFKTSGFVDTIDDKVGE